MYPKRTQKITEIGTIMKRFLEFHPKLIQRVVRKDGEKHEWTVLSCEFDNGHV